VEPVGELVERVAVVAVVDVVADPVVVPSVALHPANPVDPARASMESNFRLRVFIIQQYFPHRKGL